MGRICVLLIVATVLSTGILISTLAQFTSIYTAQDSALVAKWAFDVTVDNGSFAEFNIFDGMIMKPVVGSEEYTFNITGNRSDTAIDFEVKINLEDLIEFIGENNERFPLMLYISVMQEENSRIIYNGLTSDTGKSFIGNWFYIEDCKKSDGSYELEPVIITGHIPETNNESLAVSVKWQWNTSYFLSEEIVRSCSKDNSGDNGFNQTTVYQEGQAVYYESAKTVYNNLVNEKNDAQDVLSSWEGVHRQWLLGGTDVETTDEEGNKTIIHYPCTISCELSDALHNSEYNQLKSNLDVAKQAVKNSLKLVYDRYDTNVINGLDEKPVNIAFSVIGMQKKPE